VRVAAGRLANDPVIVPIARDVIENLGDQPALSATVLAPVDEFADHGRRSHGRLQAVPVAGTLPIPILRLAMMKTGRHMVAMYLLHMLALAALHDDVPVLHDHEEYAREDVEAARVTALLGGGEILEKVLHVEDVHDGYGGVKWRLAVSCDIKTRLDDMVRELAGPPGDGPFRTRP
jgi:hypothetical protein